jgi:hypothetical protein
MTALIPLPNRAQSASDADGLHGPSAASLIPLDIDRGAVDAGALQEDRLDLVGSAGHWDWVRTNSSAQTVGQCQRTGTNKEHI